MRLRSAHASDVGRKRTNNEDRFVDLPGLYAVADGMGGHAKGEVASQIAVDTIQRAAAHRKRPIEPALLAAITQAHRQVVDGVRGHRDREGMGTTLTAIAFGVDEAVIGHVGDSRCYQIRGGRAQQLTKDHTSGSGLNKGLDNCVGVMPGSYKGADMMQLRVEPGDLYLLATDGLDQVGADLIADVVRRQRGSLLGVVNRLVDLANGAGGHDNVTVVAVEVLP